MVANVLAFARIALAPEQSANTKQGFLKSYRHSIAKDHSLLDREVLKLIVDLAREERYRNSGVRDEAFAAIEGVVKINPDFADRDIADLAKEHRRLIHAGHLINLIQEVKPYLLAEALRPASARVRRNGTPHPPNAV